MAVSITFGTYTVSSASDSCADIKTAFDAANAPWVLDHCDATPVVLWTWVSIQKDNYVTWSGGSVTAITPIADPLPPAPGEDLSVICNVSPCTIVHQIALPPFQMTPADGALLAGAIMAVWAVGWAFRMLIRALNVDVKPPGSEA